MPQNKGKMKIPTLRKLIQIQTAFIKLLNTKGKQSAAKLRTVQKP